MRCLTCCHLHRHPHSEHRLCLTHHRRRCHQQRRLYRRKGVPLLVETLFPSATVSTLILRKKQQEKMPQGRGNQCPRSAAKRSSKSSTIVIGKKVSAGVVSWKGADLTATRYICRCAYGTTVEDVRATLEFHNVDVVSLEAIPTKHTRFSSFKLVVKKEQLDVVSNGDIWPIGVLIGPWWPSKSPTDPITATSDQIVNG